MSCADEDTKYYTLPLTTPVCKLDCSEAYKLLTDKEKMYAHHMSRASAVGSLICAVQVRLTMTSWVEMCCFIPEFLDGAYEIEAK